MLERARLSGFKSHPGRFPLVNSTPAPHAMIIKTSGGEAMDTVSGRTFVRSMVMMLNFIRLAFMRSTERFLTQWILVSTQPTHFVREHVRLGDRTNFLRAAGFFVSAISTAFFAELATLYVLGIGDPGGAVLMAFRCPDLNTFRSNLLFAHQTCCGNIAQRRSTSLVLSNWCGSFRRCRLHADGVGGCRISGQSRLYLRNQI